MIRKNISRKSTLLAGAVAAALLSVSAGVGPAFSQDPALAQSADGFAQFATYNGEDTRAVSYEPYEQLLETFTEQERGRTKIYYSAMAGTGERFVDATVEGFLRIDPTPLNRNEQLAYWLNLHNLLVVQRYAGEDPRGVKRDRGSGDEPGSLWTRNGASVNGTQMSIKDIEEKIIAAHWGDIPDVIFGLYQGAEGGPSLQEKPFTGANVRNELAAIATKYLDERRAYQVRSGRLEVSEFFAWYKPMFFGDDDARVIQLIATHAPKDRDAIAAATEVRYRKFDYGSDAIRPRVQNDASAYTGGGGGGGGYGGGGS